METPDEESFESRSNFLKDLAEMEAMVSKDIEKFEKERENKESFFENESALSESKVTSPKNQSNSSARKSKKERMSLATPQSTRSSLLAMTYLLQTQVLLHLEMKCLFLQTIVSVPAMS